MRRSSTSILLAAAALTLGACTMGSGDVMTESRQVDNFDSVVLAASGDVEIRLTGNESVEVEAEDNILPMLTTDVVNGRLELGSDGTYSTTRPVRYVITADRLNAVEISGSGDIDASSVEAETFGVSISGSGNVTVSGTCAMLDVTIAGSGDFDGTDLSCTTGSVTVSGSGEAVVDVTDDLDVEISGSGDVEYLGDPSVRTDISGSGDVRQG
jgi:hypothetical protein